VPENGRGATRGASPDPDGAKKLIRLDLDARAGRHIVIVVVLDIDVIVILVVPDIDIGARRLDIDVGTEMPAAKDARPVAHDLDVRAGGTRLDIAVDGVRRAGKNAALPISPSAKAPVRKAKIMVEPPILLLVL
jgi:hypothetical protein